MKNIKYIGILLFAIAITACESEEKIYTGKEGTLVAFSSSTYNLSIVINSVGELRAPIQVSTASPEERTFEINVISDPELTTAIPGSYNVPATITIPANSYSADLVITGTDVPGVDIDPLTLVIEIVDGATFSTGPRTTITVNQVCPILETYMVGNYQITNLVSRFSRALIETRVVNVTRTDEFTRVFPNKLLGMTADTNVNLTLVCNTIVFGAAATNLACTAGNTVKYGPATNPSPYDLADDSLFLVNYNFDTSNSCAASPTQTNSSFLMTKL